MLTSELEVASMNATFACLPESKAPVEVAVAEEVATSATFVPWRVAPVTVMVAPATAEIFVPKIELTPLWVSEAVRFTSPAVALSEAPGRTSISVEAMLTDFAEYWPLTVALETSVTERVLVRVTALSRTTDSPTTATAPWAEIVETEPVG